MTTHYHSLPVHGIDIFYREAGPRHAPTVVLLHGFPSSSHMYRDLIPHLASRFHVVAPDYPGFGNSAAPAPGEYAYTFENLAAAMEEFLQTLGVERYTLYMQDYGGPVGFRLAARHPERIQALIIQNTNAYEEGISESLAPLANYWQDRSANEAAVRRFLAKETTQFRYTHGARNPQLISPDAYNSDQAFLDRPGNDAIQLELLFQYQDNVTQYPRWHDYFSRHQPPTLIVWGKNANAELHFLDGGHFVLEEAHEDVAARITAFLSRLGLAGVRQ
ncbi:MAG: alpha/beta fold hydrolase [Bryobacterales bacterium]|nr:alpha/beta fold hydrolase [Bryobacterales bacterium]